MRNTRESWFRLDPEILVIISLDIVLTGARRKRESGINLKEKCAMNGKQAR